MPAPYYKTSVVYADLGFDVDYYFLDSNFVDAKPPEDECSFSFANMYLHIQHACMHACMHACIHTYIHTYISMYTYTWTCIIENIHPYNGYQGPSLIL